MEAILKVRDLRTYFETERGIVRAVDGVDLSVNAGRTVAVVGESGCGKTVLALSILRLLPMPPGRILDGSVMLNGRDLLTLPIEEMRRVRGKEISMIFQEPMTSLNPVFRVGEQIAEVFRLHQRMNRNDALRQSVEMLRMVGIPSPERRAMDYPHQMSGGMRQRVMIAIALSCRPRVMLADEPTTALDVTIQAQVLELMHELRRKINTSLVMITHDLGIVAEMCDKVAIMYAGRVVEYASTEALYNRPAHPYTEGLFNSIPDIDRDEEELKVIQGLLPDPTNLPSGCSFHPRCPYAIESCSKDAPPMVEIEPGHFVACPVRFEHWKDAAEGNGGVKR